MSDNSFHYFPDLKTKLCFIVKDFTTTEIPEPICGS
jgi:hypothetical protein